jgi:NADH:ubiquinone oxidoreductase subunit 5 (subunit L)/multisubunit Na+/H+ antiporter MnhA subunit
MIERFDLFFPYVGALTVLSPMVLLAILGMMPLFGVRLSERFIANAIQTSVSVGWICSLLILASMWSLGIFKAPLIVGSWVSIPTEHFHLEIKFIFDRLSLPFLILSYTLCGVIGAFASRYLHRDEGYYRFFLFYAIFFLGMVLSTLAGTIETLFLGWELVGLSSALLVAFFHYRKNPVRNGLRVWAIYRISDGAFLLAALAMHHLTGEGDFEVLMGAAPWPAGAVSCSEWQAFGVGLLLLVAAAGKSALVPFSGWLPRAMEGPTPSSAVFYGALSVHLGVYMLLRVSPLLDQSVSLRIAVLFIGGATVIFSAIAGSVQTDIKSVLAFASLTQVSIIVIEIGIGLRYLALCHIIGHVTLRTLQLLRAPSVLKDYQAVENAIGNQNASTSKRTLFQLRWEDWFYRFAMERGMFDVVMDEYIVSPFLKLFSWCDRIERGWLRFLSSDPLEKQNANVPSPSRFEPEEFPNAEEVPL